MCPSQVSPVLGQPETRRIDSMTAGRKRPHPIWVVTSALWVLVWASGCPPGVSVTMFNQTAERLTFVVWNAEYSVAPGRSVVFPYSERTTLRCQRGDLAFHFPYELRNGPREFLEMRPFRIPSRAIRMEIRGDNFVHLVPPGATGPGATPCPRQYRGFPARPGAARAAPQ